MNLYKPDRSNFTALDAQRYLNNFLIEVQEIPFTLEERKLLLQAMFGKLIDERTRPFFFYHFSPLLTKAVKTFFCEEQSPLIVDLGCGSGSASILFGLLGAKVIGIDLEPNLISACRKRQAFYEAEFGPLNICFHVADALRFDYDQVAPIDGIYSLFAFNMMQPSRDLLARIIPRLARKGKIVISDGNMYSLYNRFFRPRSALTPGEMQLELLANHAKVISLEFHCMLPPAVVQIRPIFDLGLKLERTLERLGLMRWLGVSYTVVAEKQDV